MEAAGVEPASKTGLTVIESGCYVGDDDPVSALASAVGAGYERVCGVSDPDLRHVVDAWARLPVAVRAGILAMVRSVVETGDGS